MSIYPPDYTTDIGKVRALIQDSTEPYMFEDEEITVFLAVSGDSVLRAAANALYTIAANEALMYKYVKTDDLLIDGTKAADVLLKRARAFIDQADSGDLSDADESFLIVYPFNRECGVPEATARPVWC